MAAQVTPSAQVYPRAHADNHDQGAATQISSGESGIRSCDRLSPCASTASPRAFVIGVGITLVLGLMGLFAFSWYVNPWGDFGTTGFHRLYNARLAKANYLDQLPRDELPQVVVMGSSNTMQYSPATIQRLMGKTAFNFGVFWGRTEDFLCITRYLVEDLDHRPELLILGIDTWSFVPAMSEHPVFPGIRRRLLTTPQLVRHLPGANSVKLHWANYIDSLSVQQLRLSWKLLNDDRYRRTTALPLEDSQWLARDGTRIRYAGPTSPNIFTDVESGNYSITQELRQSTRQLHREDPEKGFATEYFMYDYQDVDQVKVGYMIEFLELCQRENIPIVVAINPVHPFIYQELNRCTRHPKNLDRLRSMLRQYEEEYPVIQGIVDASDIESMGGDPEGFFDGLHPATRNCDLIIEQIAAIARQP